MLHNRKTPHGLIELSCKQWSRISHNSIILDKICIHVKVNGSKCITYESIDLGDGIKMNHEKVLSNKKTIHWKQILVIRMKHNFVAIITRKENIVFQNDFILIFSTNNNGVLDSKYVVKKCIWYGFFMSCKVQIITEKNIYKWGKMKSLMLQMCKRNVINVAFSRHGSAGKYYCYGNKANYRIIEKSSVTRYFHKKFYKEKLNSLSIEKLTM